jgi:hypothetical protein
MAGILHLKSSVPLSRTACMPAAKSSASAAPGPEELGRFRDSFARCQKVEQVRVCGTKILPCLVDRDNLSVAIQDADAGGKSVNHGDRETGSVHR